MPPVPAWFRARLHAALDAALNASNGDVKYAVEGLRGLGTFWIRASTAMTDDGLDAAMDAVVRLGSDGKPLMHLTGAEGEGRAACGFDGPYLVSTTNRADVTCPACRDSAPKFGPDGRPIWPW
jgi:hypothetical protein